MSYFNNFFTTDQKRKDFYESKGLGDNQQSQEFYNKGFNAADSAGQKYLSDFDFNNGTGIDWDSFSSGMSEARQKGWDDWWSENSNKGYNSLNTDDLFSFSGETDPWDAFLANNPNQGAYFDLVNNTQTKRAATQSDVDAGIANAIGEEIVDFNIPSLYDAQKAGYYETIKDLIDANKFKEIGAQDYLQQLLGLVDKNKESLESSLDAYKTEEDLNISNSETRKESAIKTLQDALKTNSDTLAQAQSDNALAKFQAITDALRGDNILAKRLGEYGTSGATNKLLVDALMRSEQDKAGVLADINLEKAQRTYEIENNRASLNKAVKDWTDSTKYQLYTNVSQQRKGLRDRVAEQEMSFNQNFQNQLLAMRNEFAAAIGSTPDETDPILQLVQEYIAIQAAKGKVNIENEIEYYKANKDVLQQIVDNPNSFIQLLGMQIADEVQALGYKDEMTRDLRQSKFDNIGDITAIIEGLADYENNNELRSIVEELNQLSSVMQGMGGTLGTNPTQRPDIVIPETDLSALTEILSQASAGGGGNADELSSKVIDWVLDWGKSLFEDEEEE